MFTSNGVQYFNGIGTDLTTARFTSHSLIGIFDWDATVAYESVVHNLEETVYPLFYKANGLFDSARVRKAFTASFDLLYTPIAIYHAMALEGRAPCERSEMIEKLIKPFITVFEAVESSVYAHEGAFEAISQLRKQHSDCYFPIMTQCPFYLGLMRAKKTGMINLFDGIVGIRQECPEELLQYEAELNFVNDWIAAQLSDVDLSRFKVIAGVPDNLVKPNPLHAEVALGSKPGVFNTLIAFDDKPRRMAKVARQFAADCPSFYVQARVSTWENATTEIVDGYYSSMGELVRVVRNTMAANAVVA